jgi:hypothetical protein
VEEGVEASVNRGQSAGQGEQERQQLGHRSSLRFGGPGVARMFCGLPSLQCVHEVTTSRDKNERGQLIFCLYIKQD